MNNLDIYCVTNKIISSLDKTDYKIGWVGKESPPSNYLSCNSGDNIFYKEKFYSELTFQYWFWKNIFEINSKKWIGFCQKRRFWIEQEYLSEKIDKNNFFKFTLKEIAKKDENFDSIICNPISVNNVKKIKMIKRGFKSILNKPQIFFDSNKQTVNFHFDMHHGYGNLSKAITLVNREDRSDFFDYVNTSTSYNPHIMFIAKPKIVNKWFETLFSWLFECEKIFKFDELKGYDTQRLFAYLAERYLSFWFKKHTNFVEKPWIFIDQ